MLFSLPGTVCSLQDMYEKIRLHYILMSLEQQRSPLPSTNIPHDNAVVRGT